MPELSLIQKIIIYALPILYAITVHEAAHGYVAQKFGDNTAKDLGRISFNPIKHIDLIGTIIVPIAMVISTSAIAGTPIIFGWAKPVPVNPRNLRKPKTHMAYVAAAGPFSNLLMALFWASTLKLSIVLLNSQLPGGIALFYMSQAGILINLVLMILNLFPIPPLDGSKVLMAVLPKPFDLWMLKLERVGLIIVLLLIFSGLLGKVMIPLLIASQKIILTVFGIT